MIASFRRGESKPEFGVFQTIPFIGNRASGAPTKPSGRASGVEIHRKGQDAIRAGASIYYNNIQTLLNFSKNRNLTGPTS